MQPRWHAGTLAAEEQAVAVLVAYIPKTAVRLGREQPEPPRRMWARPKRRPIRVLVHIERLPIIHSRAPEVTIIDHVPQRMDEVQPRSGERAHPSDVPRVRRN